MEQRVASSFESRSFPCQQDGGELFVCLPGMLSSIQSKISGNTNVFQLSQGYAYCGVGNAGASCTGGNHLSAIGAPVDFNSCGIFCTDAPTELCGDYSGVMELYERAVRRTSKDISFGLMSDS